jgi:transcriptional regulator with XRE-family HTH domain
MELFPENLRRLLGLHDLDQAEAAEMLGMSKASFSAWNSGRRQPSFQTALHIGEFFGVPADRLARAEFEDLLAHELADPDRFREVEAEIRRRRSTLREVEAKPAAAEKLRTVRKVTAMDEAREAQQKRRGRAKGGPSTPEEGR